MGPKNKRKKLQQDDQQFEKKQKNLQLLLKEVEKKKNNKNSRQDEQQQMDQLNQKQVFNWEVKRKELKALKLKQQKEQQRRKQRQEKQAQQNKLTQQQKAQILKKLEKQKIQKQEKRKKQQQKKLERQKLVTQQKIEQQRKKEQQQRQAQQVEKKLKAPQNNGKSLPVCLLICIIILFGLQYQKEIYTRLNKFKLQGQQNFYQIFQIDSGVTDKQLKQKYKRLVLKYHPDKNPNCLQCEDKFNQIIKAWQVLGNSQKRKHYDANAGFVTQIKSQSITLTPSNYQQLIKGSRSLWMIQVYDSTQKYCHYFSQFWQDVVKQYGNYIKFGRIDVWTQSNMLSYLPYKFQVFPSIYFCHKGQVGVCQFDFQQPDWSIKRCIQTQYKQNIVKSIQKVQSIEKNQKPTVLFTEKVKLGSRYKIINKKYQSDFNFYQLTSKSQKMEIIGTLPDGTYHTMIVNPKEQEVYQKYQKFLESLIVQTISICELITRCESEPCFILIPQDRKYQVNKTILPRQSSTLNYPVFQIKQQEKFYQALQDLKNKTLIHQNFDLGLYQNGHIDLGYMNQAQMLKAEEGQNFQQLQCHYEDRSWLGKIKSLINWVSKLF